MTLDRWERVQRLTHAVRERPPHQRQAWLAHACGDDRETRRAVEMLLAADGSDGLRSTSVPDLPARFGPDAILGPLPTGDIGEIARQAPDTVPATQVSPDRGWASVDEFPGTARFVVQRRLGSGGFGAVYEAYDRDEQRPVALKVLRRLDPEFLLGFKREFRGLVDLRHPNLVALYELFSEGEFWFFTMELVRGVNFLRYVAPGLPSDYAVGGAACDLGRLRVAASALARGLEHVHDAGILHCDVKPANVLVSSDGCARLLDFGLVREADARTAQTVVIGTPAYMSPEQAQGLPLSLASDWYSFGVMLFQALTGALPDRSSLLFPGDADLRSPSACAPGLPDDFDGLCRDLLHPDPARRPTGAEVVERLAGSARNSNRAARVALPTAGDLIGRESHLAALADLLHAARRGRAVVVNLCGQSGIGKTALLRAFRDRLREQRDVVVLSGCCHEAETVPFKALDELVDGLSRYLKALPDAEAEALAPRDAQYLVRVFPVLGQVDAITRIWRKAATITDSQELRERAFASLQDLLSRLSDHTTVVLAIDDLQWGDLDSAAFLGRLLTAPSPPGVLFIASYRQEDAGTSLFLRRWHAQLANARSVMVHDLEARELSAADARALVERLLPATTSDGARQASAIAAESGGSPFLIDQLAQCAVADGHLSQAAVSVGEVIERRLAGLSEDARALVETIALAGRPLSRAVASAAAAGADADSYASVTSLVRARLVRIRETGGPKELEVYHDRLRETITASIPAGRRRDLHLRLARAWEDAHEIDPAVLALHFAEGGDLASAARHSVAAAEHAAHALAFDRAADLYQRAIAQGHWSGDALVDLQRKLAVTLAHAGRGAQAAEVYLDAARNTQSSVSVELKRLAAEQLFRSGHTEDGVDLLRVIARDAGIWLPARPWHAGLSILWHGGRIVLRGLKIREGPPTSERERVRAALDVYWSLGIGLGFVDVVRGWDFQTRHLLLALQAGDPHSAAMSMAANAAAIAGHGARLSDALLAKARELSADTDQPHVRALIPIMETLSATMRGDWPEAARLSERADRILQEQSTGVAWERSFNSSLGRTAALLLGEWRTIVEHATRLREQVHEARERGDIHTLHFLLNVAYIGHLAADRPNPESELYDEVIACLPRDGFYVPHLLSMFSHVDTALYEGKTPQAWAFVNRAWPGLSNSMLLRIKHLSTIAWQMRGRAAVAMAAPDGGERRRYLREAVRSARQIERRRTRWGRGMALLIHASVASVTQDRAATLHLLLTAEGHLEAAHMQYLVAACRYRRGQLAGGAEGQTLTSLAEAWAERAGVVNLPRIVDMLVPGLWERVRSS